MSIRGEWMKYVHMGKKLGEAIEMSIQFMHIKDDVQRADARPLSKFHFALPYQRPD